MKQKKILRELTAYQQGKQIHEIKKEFGLEKIVKLSSNENVYGYSEQVKTYLQNHLPDLELYPDGHASKLRTTLANKLNVSEDELLFGSGSEEIIQIICRAFVETGKNTVMAANSFPQYKHNTLVEGGTVKEVPVRQNGKHDLEAMHEAIDENTVVVWICAPDNPTGTLITEEEFLGFMDKCPEDVLVVLDEAYREYVQPDQVLNSFSYIQSYNNLISLRTFSKIYGLAGLRVGYAVGNPETINYLNVVRGPFNTTSIAQEAATVALSDQSFVQDSAKGNREVRDDFARFLDSIGWTYYPSHTNFLLVSTPTSGFDMFDYLIKHGFIVRQGELLGYPNTVRITIGLKKDMEQLKQIIKNFHGQIG